MQPKCFYPKLFSTFRGIEKRMRESRDQCKLFSILASEKAQVCKECETRSTEIPIRNAYFDKQSECERNTEIIKPIHKTCLIVISPNWKRRKSCKWSPASPSLSFSLSLFVVHARATKHIQQKERQRGRKYPQTAHTISAST